MYLRNQPSICLHEMDMYIIKSCLFIFPGNGTQQFISIPVSMATGGNQQIQLISTSNGQIVATNLSNLALNNPLGATLANTG